MNENIESKVINEEKNEEKKSLNNRKKSSSQEFGELFVNSVSIYAFYTTKLKRYAEKTNDQYLKDETKYMEKSIERFHKQYIKIIRKGNKFAKKNKIIKYKMESKEIK